MNKSSGNGKILLFHLVMAFLTGGIWLIIAGLYYLIVIAKKK